MRRTVGHAEHLAQGQETGALRGCPECLAELARRRAETEGRCDLVVDWPDGRQETIRGEPTLGATFDDAPAAPAGIARIRARVLLPATAPTARLTGPWAQGKEHS